VAETVLRHHLYYHSIMATQTSHVALPPHTLQPAQVRPTSATNEGHFTLAFETVSSPYLDYNCNASAQAPYVTLIPPHYNLPNWSNSVSKEGHLTLNAETVFPTYLDYHFIVATQTSHMAIPQTLYNQSKIGRNR
jgi:hypothetical protein